MASAQTFEEGERCSHCWRTMPELTEPRALPCGHVSCTECLEVKYRIHKGARCETCHTVEELDIKDLPIATVQMPELTKAVTCDRHECTGIAFHFCVKCGEKLCEDDLRLHNGFFREGHNIISMIEYEQSARKYQKSFCEKHKDELLIKACENCKKLICNQCDRSEGPCSDQNDCHRYSELATLAEKITLELKGVLAEAAQKNGEFQEADKNSWNRLEEKEKTCNVWIQKVEKSRHDHFQQLEQAYDKILDEIREMKEKAHDEVVRFNTNLIKEREALEESRNKVSQLANNGSSSEIIRLEGQLKEQLRQNIDRPVGSPAIEDNTALIKREQAISTISVITPLPSQLLLSLDLPTESSCYTISHQQDGNILVGCRNKLKLFNSTTKELSAYDLPYSHYGAALVHKNSVFVLQKKDATRTGTVELHDLNLTHVKTLFEFKITLGKVDGLAVSDKYVVVFIAGKPPKNLLIYDRANQQIKYHSLLGSGYIYLLENSYLLVSGRKLSKYKIEDETLCLIWTSAHLTNMRRVCVGPQQMIYAAIHSSTKSIYILSPEGIKLRELSHEKLPGADVGQISIKGNELAVPCWMEKRMCIFKII